MSINGRDHDQRRPTPSCPGSPTPSRRRSGSSQGQTKNQLVKAKLQDYMKDIVRRHEIADRGGRGPRRRPRQGRRRDHPELRRRSCPADSSPRSSRSSPESCARGAAAGARPRSPTTRPCHCRGSRGSEVRAAYDAAWRDWAKVARIYPVRVEDPAAANVLAVAEPTGPRRARDAGQLRNPVRDGARRQGDHQDQYSRRPRRPQPGFGADPRDRALLSGCSTPTAPIP